MNEEIKHTFLSPTGEIVAEIQDASVMVTEQVMTKKQAEMLAWHTYGIRLKDHIMPINHKETAS